MGFWGPDGAAGSLAVAISRTVERDHPVFLRRHVDEAARLEILNHAAVTVQQDQRFAAALIEIVESNAIHYDEFAKRRIVLGRLLRNVLVRKGEARQRCCDAYRCCHIRARIHAGGRMQTSIQTVLLNAPWPFVNFLFIGPCCAATSSTRLVRHCSTFWRAAMAPLLCAIGRIPFCRYANLKSLAALDPIPTSAAPILAIAHAIAGNQRRNSGVVATRGKRRF